MREESLEFVLVIVASPQLLEELPRQRLQTSSHIAVQRRVTYPLEHRCVVLTSGRQCGRLARSSAAVSLACMEAVLNSASPSQ